MRHSNVFKTAFLVIPIAACMLFVASAAQAEDNFCWRDTYGRGVGQVPENCPAGMERVGLFCYEACGPNMKRVGFDCHSVCPDDMRDDGLFCRAEEYGRGAGYPWEFGDALDEAGMLARCEADHGVGNCEAYGAVYYPKCAEGYEPYGCCICRPQVPDCEALGLLPGIDLSCAKVVELGAPEIGLCNAGDELDAGLCYPVCTEGYTGVGPVCWAGAPEGWVECGMGAAVDTASCVAVTTNQVITTINLALTIASYGAQLNGNVGLAEIEQIQELFSQLVGLLQQISEIPELAEYFGNFEEDTDLTLEDFLNAETPEEQVRIAATFLSAYDPTGIAATVAAYTYPICSSTL